MPGKFLNERSQELIYNVYEYFCRERDNFGVLDNVQAVLKRTSSALKVCDKTIRKIILSKRMGTPLPTTIKRSCKKPKTKDMSEGLKHTIRDTVYDMYAKKEHVTLQTIKNVLHDKGLLEASRPTIRNILLSIGFKYKKDCNRRALCEKRDVASARVRFLKNYIQNMQKESPLPVVFLDETWIFNKGSVKRSWQDETPKSVKNAQCSSTGKRYIILHAGNSSGFIEDASLIFATKSKSSDYHDNMDATVFEKWLKEQLLPKLSEPSIIVMDNASYHSRLVERTPSSSWKKAEILKWLQTKNIPFSDSDLRIDLLQLAKQHKSEKCYIVDNIILEHGHFILRLPPYHCQFNAIENIWGICKSYYDKNIGRDGYSDNNVLQMWEESLKQCDGDIWKKTILHAEKLIVDGWSREKVLDVVVEPLIISVGDSDTEDSYSDYDDSEVPFKTSFN